MTPLDVPKTLTTDTYDDIVDHCCEAWNRLVDRPWTIMSISMRDWAHGSRL